MSEKKKYENLTTPSGIAKFPRLNKPETEVNGQTLDKPRFKVTLIMDEADEGVTAFKADLDKRHAAAIAVAEKKKKADPKRAKKQLVINPPYRDHLDEDGNPVEGKFEVTAKTSAEKDDGTPKTVKMFDAKGKPTKANIGGGSKLKLNVTPGAYDSNLGAGLSLYLNAVQILALEEFSGGNAKSFGFGEEKDGYEGSDAGDESFPQGDAPAGDGNADDSVPDDAAQGGAKRAKGDF